MFMSAFRHPWKPRGIRVHGVADAITRQGRFAFGIYIRVKPAVKWSWGIEEATFRDGKPIIKKTKEAEHQWHTSPLSTTAS
jgi:hypothetical protein